MPETTLTADIGLMKSQLETEISKYQAEIYLRQAKIHALDVFGDSDTVQNWLTDKNPGLDRLAPIDLLNSESGLERVIALLERTKSKLARLRERIDIMEKTAIDPQLEADFERFIELFDTQRSIDSQLFNHR
jgi:Protein of unknown function (DUF2384)